MRGQEDLDRQRVVEVVVEQLPPAVGHLQIVHTLHHPFKQRDLRVLLLKDEVEVIGTLG
jgi:hypothetical protein